MRIKAIIPARAGSLRVKNKNLRPFAGSTLLEIKIKQLLQVPDLDDVCVNSEDDQTLEIAKAAGATPIQRDPYYSTSEILANEMYRHVAENIDCEYVLFANCTNPLADVPLYSNAIKMFFDCKSDYDSVNSVKLVKEFLWKEGSPINYDRNSQPRSQDLPDVMSLTFAISVLSRKNMMQYKSVIGKKPKFIVTDELSAIDIDTELDFKIAEMLYREELWQR